MVQWRLQEAFPGDNGGFNVKIVWVFNPSGEISAFDPGGGLHHSLIAIAIDLIVVGEGKGNVLPVKLDGLSDYVSGFTVVDSKRDLTDLKSMSITGNAEMNKWSIKWAWVPEKLKADRAKR